MPEHQNTISSTKGAVGENSVASPQTDEVSLSRRFRVLVADDDEDARSLISLALQERNLEIVLCNDAEQALASCIQTMPDLAIIDVHMPGKSGLEVCQWIKEKANSTFIPVILITSLIELDDKLRGFQGGADDYVTKPFLIPELEARVRAFLRIKELTDDLRSTQQKLAAREKELVATQVAGAAAHELGQPLTSLLLNCALLSQLSPESKELKETLQEINAQCQRIRKIMKVLNQFQGYKTKEYSENVEIVDLGIPTPERRNRS